MFPRFACFHVLASTAILWCHVVAGEGQKDVVFAGKTLCNLRSAVAVSHVKIMNRALLKDLGGLQNDRPDIPLAVLLVPKDAGPSRAVVWKLYDKGDTHFTEEEVYPNDVETLRKFDRDGVFLALNKTLEIDARARVPGSDISFRAVESSVKELSSDIAKQSEDQRKASELFAGAVLADAGIRQGAAEDLVEKYRGAQGAKIKKLLAGKSLEEGKPYVYGAQQELLTWNDLASLPKDAVKDIKVGDVKYKQTWVGSNSVIVKPSQFAKSDPRTGAEKLGLDPDTLKQQQKESYCLRQQVRPIS